MALKTLDINADMGESYGNFHVGQDEALMPFLTSCNIACGYHGGDPLTIHRTIENALKHDVAIGAHPSYPDLQGFGRRRMIIPPSELKRMIEYQVFAVKGMVESQGGKLHHVKPHGALNNHMMDDPSLLTLILETILGVDPNLLIYVPYQPSISKEAMIRFEMFADRTYEDDLKLTPRSIDGSLIHQQEEVIAHLKPILASKKIRTRQGVLKDIEVDTICIHGDNPGAIDIAQKIHEVAQENQVSLSSVV